MKTESTKSSALLDTNILVYAYAENSAKRERATKLLNDCFNGKTALALSLQNVGEFCNIALTKYKLKRKDVWETAEELLRCRNFLKVHYSKKTFKQAIDMAGENSVGFWDAMLAATMEENGVNTIYTEDERFNRIKGIKAVNPFLK